MERTSVPKNVFIAPWVPDHPRVRTPNAPPISNEEWNRHRDKIIHLYIQLDLTLDEVIQVMHAHNLWATKRQYTWKLKEWGCRKYNIPFRDEHSSQSKSSSANSTSLALENALAPSAQEINDAARNLPSAAAVEPPNVAIITTNGDSEVFNMENCDAEIGHDHNSRAAATASGSHGFDFDFDLMDRELPTISEEHQVSSLGIFDGVQIGNASSQNYSSPASDHIIIEHSRSLSRSHHTLAKVPTPSLADDWIESPISGVPCTSVENSLLLEEAPDKARVDRNSDTAAVAAVAEVTGRVALLAGNTSFALPVVVPARELTRKVSLVALLLPDTPDRIFGELSKRDYSTVEQLAELLECARSYEDAYQLYRLLFMKNFAAACRDSVRDRTCEKALTKVLKNANNAAAHKEAVTFTEQQWGHRPGSDGRLLARNVQESYLGSMFGSRADFHSAERCCQRALDRMLVAKNEQLDELYYRPTPRWNPSGEFAAAWLIVITNLLLIWEEKEKLKSRDAWLRVEDLSPGGFVMPHKNPASWLLQPVVGWCLSVLTEDGLQNMLLPITPDLWLSAPTDADLRDVESTLFFFYLWSQMQPNEQPSNQSTSNGANLQPNCLLELAQAWGIPVTEVLSVVANFIITTNHRNVSGGKPTFAQRVHTAVKTVYHSMEEQKGPAKQELMFMETYAAVRRQKRRQFSTQSYATLVRTTVREIVESYVHIELGVSTFRDSRLQFRLSQASMAPSYSPTMLSTPRSSWSGYRSFVSIGRRASRIWANSNISNDDMQSLISSHRWSRASSIKSALTFQSATSNRDIPMEDDTES